ncbi:hypothetical protein ACGF12_22685 [Kitasatospora sp. NPDC048296]|uniref:hypothetical protein n=1 Tax=Kitasatospora sp. NPDC048296 TaxID=3364048 RepID=UPI00371B9801
MLPVLGAAVLLTIGLALVVPGSSHHGAAHPPAAAATPSGPATVAGPPPATPSPETRIPSPTAAAPASPGSPSAAPVPSGVAAAGDGPQGDPAIQAALSAQYPSDLPPAEADKLTALARDIWLAETTGTGRDRWPAYFPATAVGASRPYFYTGVRVQAAVAHTSRDTADRAAVNLLWVGTSPTGDYGDHRPATLFFTRVNDTWEPQR